MKLAVIGLVAAVALVAAGLASAIGSGRSANVMPLQAGQAISYAGLTCSTYAGTTATNANIVCVRNNLRGFGVVISQETVLVAKQINGKVKVYFRTTNR
jgi:hypothetical protein